MGQISKKSTEDVNVNLGFTTTVEYVSHQARIVEMDPYSIHQLISVFVEFLPYGYMDHVKLFQIVMQTHIGMELNVLVNMATLKEVTDA